ncbi:hypothetical protein ACU4GD_09055 [Cupriavidus basilensis]
MALAMIVENAGFGGAVAAPIARKVMDYYLLGKWPAELENIAPPVASERAGGKPPVDTPSVFTTGQHRQHRQRHGHGRQRGRRHQRRAPARRPRASQPVPVLPPRPLPPCRRR